MDFGKITDELRTQETYSESDMERYFSLSCDFKVVDNESANKALEMCLKARKKRQEILSRKSEIQSQLKASLDEIILNMKEEETSLQLAEDNFLGKLYDFYQNKQVHIKTDNGSLKSVNKWSFVIRDKDQVPAEYKCNDLKAIDEAIKMGIRHIPGVEIFVTSQLALRVKSD